MSNYNIRSGINFFLVSAVTSPLCTYIICMNSPTYSAVQIVREKLRAGELAWRQMCSISKTQAEIELRDHFEKLDYIEDGADFLTSLNTVLRRGHEGKFISPETREKIDAYGEANRKFGLLKSIEENFAWSTRDVSNEASPYQVYNKLQEVIVSTASNSSIKLSDVERMRLKNITDITGREQQSRREQ
jgi:hypothetical protein